MMRRFQIWHPSSNPVTFEPLLAKTMLKIGKIPNLANFRQVFGLKADEMSFYSNFNVRFGILSSFNISLVPHLLLFSHLKFLASHVEIEQKMRVVPHF